MISLSAGFYLFFFQVRRKRGRRRTRARNALAKSHMEKSLDNSRFRCRGVSIWNNFRVVRTNASVVVKTLFY